MTENPEFGAPEREEPTGELIGTARFEAQQAGDEVQLAEEPVIPDDFVVDVAASTRSWPTRGRRRDRRTTPGDRDQGREPLVELHDVTVKFGGLTALDEVTFDIKRGEILGLIGPNGAGKTTCFNAMTGVYRPTSGTVTFDRQVMAKLKRNQITRLGIARTFQNVRLFGEMTALENVVVGTDARHRTSVPGATFRTPRHRHEERDAIDRGMALLEFVGVGGRATEKARNLPYGDQRRLEIARALATEPKLLCLDEPAAGFNPAEKAALMDLIRKIRGRRLHRAADRARHAAGDGRDRPDRGAGVRQEDRRRAARRRSATIRRSSPPTWGCPTMPLLEINDMTVAYGRIEALHGISLSVEEGELVTLIGANGAGKTTTMRAISGIRPLTRGSDHLRRPGHHQDEGPPAGDRRHRAGAGGPRRLPGDDGPGEPGHGPLRPQVPDPRPSTRQTLDRVFELFPRLAERRTQMGGTMSGGEQQMVAIGRALMARPRVLLLDEPSMGLAPMIIQQIFRIISEINKTGVRRSCWWSRTPSRRCPAPTGRTSWRPARCQDRARPRTAGRPGDQRGLPRRRLSLAGARLPASAGRGPCRLAR